MKTFGTILFAGITAAVGVILMNGAVKVVKTMTAKANGGTK